MALVEEDVRQRLRQRFSHLPEPVFDECLRTNPTNLNLCITQLKERSQAQERRDPMCAVSAGMDPAQQHAPQPPPQHLQHHQQHQQQRLQQQGPEGSQDGRLNSDGWFELTWPPKMNAGGDKVDPRPSRTPEANEPTGGWQGYRDLCSFSGRPPLQVSKISVNLQDSGQRAKSPGLVQPIRTPSPSRTYDAGNGSRTPGTPDSIGLESSITLPGISPPRDRTPSPFTNPFFPPIDHNALRASLQSNGRSSPGVAYQYPRSASPRPHAPPNQNTSTSPLHYNSPVAPMPIVGQPNVVSSQPVAPLQRNTPEPRQDVRRKISQPEVNSPHPESAGGGVSGVGLYGGAARHVSNAQAPQSYPTSTQRPPAAQGPESAEYRKRMGSQEELRYNQALIMHQNARKERLRKDLTEEQVKLERMRGEIRSMEHDLNTKRSHRSPFPSNEQLSKTREEKRQLQIDIECMNKEIDTFKKQGFTNPHTQEYFYANIDQGPIGPIPPGPPVAPDPITPPVLDPDEGQQWACTHCTFLNHPFLDKCECCEMPRDSA